MYEKKKRPYMTFLLLLIPVLAFSYLVGGLFKIPGITIQNIQDNLTYVLLHPFDNWWNDKSIPCMLMGFMAWFMLIGWYTYNYRDYHFGQEHGSEDWADINNLSKILPDKDDQYNRLLSKNVKVSKKILSNNNMLVIGASGSYKTTSLVIPNLLRITNTKVILDVKGDLQYGYGNYLRQKGVAIHSLNLKEPWKSDRFNPFVYIERESDLMRLVTTLHSAVEKPDAMKGDPFWDDGVDLYLQAMFFFEWLNAKEEKRVGNMNNILRLVNMETQKVDEETTCLQQAMDELAERKGPLYPPVRDYRKLKDGATETVRSIILMVNTMLKLCETADIKRIFSGNDINIRELGMGVDDNPRKKSVLFLVLPDNDSTYNFLIAMFYTLMFDVLMRIADDEVHGPLPIEVEVWMDEFYAGAKPANPDVLLGVIRSRNIVMIPILQSVAQIKTLFKNDKWETILDNAATMIYLGAGPGASSTHKYISELLGKSTIDTRTDGMNRGRNGSTNINNAKAGRELMTPAEVKRMNRDNCIIFLEGQSPIFDEKNKPFHTKEFNYARSLGAYEHPVHVVYDDEKMEYITIEQERLFQELTPDDAIFYRKAAEKNKNITVIDVEARDFLYMNWKKPKLTEEQVIALYQDVVKKEFEDGDLPEDVKAVSENDKSETSSEEAVGEIPVLGWDLSGSIFECIKRYSNVLTPDQMEEIVQGLEIGLSEKQVKTYFNLPVEEMRLLKRVYKIENHVSA